MTSHTKQDKVYPVKYSFGGSGPVSPIQLARNHRYGWPGMDRYIHARASELSQPQSDPVLLNKIDSLNSMLDAYNRRPIYVDVQEVTTKGKRVEAIQNKALK